MKTAKSILIAFLFVAVGLSPLFAQQSIDARIDKIRLTSEKTPYFSSSGHSSQGNWLAINVDFSTKVAGEWLNDLDVRFVVLMELENGRFVYMDKAITYVDVQNGRQHHVVAYVKPAFFERYMKSGHPDASRINVYVELYANGQRIARNDRRGIRKLPDDWYKSTASTKSFPDSLIPKYKTPFAFLDYDYYENEKQQ